MDYSLSSLKDAFEDGEYRRSNREFKLFALLLATSLDQQFIMEYLHYFKELHELTGEFVLVIGPQLVNSTDHRPDWEPPEILIREGALAEAGRIVAPQVPFDVSNRDIDRNDAAAQFLRFMQDQTRESYSIARYLGISANQMPAFVFFKTLDFPQDFVVWPLHRKTGREFVLDLRSLLGDLGERCQWGLEERIKTLRDQFDSMKRRYLYGDRPTELREAWEAHDKTRDAFNAADAAVKFHEKLKTLRETYDRANADINLKVPLVNVGRTISKLEAGQIDHDSFNHLSRHWQRWKGRMPADYKAAIQGFYYPSLAVDDGKIRYTLESAIEQANRLKPEVDRLRNIYDAKLQALISEAERPLQEALDVAARPAQQELAVIRNILKGAATNAQAPHSGLSLREMIAGNPPAVPKAFISYSHDSDQHKARVLEFAQRLRGDGVDCWIDQFEDSPPQGFPRWMQQQISQADYVLLVCSPTYRKRFDGLEDVGKGKGANFEGHLILQTFYDDSTLNRKFIPLVFPDAKRDEVPLSLRGSTSYQIPVEYDSLKRRLFGVPNVVPQPLGQSLGGAWQSF
jgi:hypothetical protein